MYLRRVEIRAPWDIAVSLLLPHDRGFALQRAYRAKGHPGHAIGDARAREAMVDRLMFANESALDELIAEAFERTLQEDRAPVYGRPGFVRDAPYDALQAMLTKLAQDGVLRAVVTAIDYNGWGGTTEAHWHWGLPDVLRSTGVLGAYAVGDSRDHDGRRVTLLEALDGR